MKKLLGIVVLGLLLSGNAYSEEIELSCNGKYQNKEVSAVISVDKTKKEIIVKNEVAFFAEDFKNYNYKTKNSTHTDEFISIFVEIYLNDKIVRAAEYTIDHEFKSLKVTAIDYILAEDAGNNGLFGYDLNCKLN